jgi:hypothetical protein
MYLLGQIWTLLAFDFAENIKTTLKIKYI